MKKRLDDNVKKDAVLTLKANMEMENMIDIKDTDRLVRLVNVSSKCGKQVLAAVFAGLPIISPLLGVDCQVVVKQFDDLKTNTDRQINGLKVKKRELMGEIQ